MRAHSLCPPCASRLTVCRPYACVCCRRSVRYGRSRKPVGRLHEYAQNVNIYSYCVCVNSARVPSLLASACSDANTRVLGGFDNLLSYNRLVSSVAPCGFFSLAKEPFRGCGRAFSATRKRLSGTTGEPHPACRKGILEMRNGAFRQTVKPHTA